MTRKMIFWRGLNRKRFLFSTLLVLTAACFPMHKAKTPIQDAEYDQPDTEEYEDNEPVEWAGPGWYWGIYIDNEDDYWNHYHNHSHQGRGGYHQGGGHGGGGHGGGGHH
ncbi:MAG: hypothetical protein WCF19_07285 [Chlamydiales bacterium]